MVKVFATCHTTPLKVNVADFMVCVFHHSKLCTGGNPAHVHSSWSLDTHPLISEKSPRRSGSKNWRNSMSYLNPYLVFQMFSRAGDIKAQV